MIPVIGTAWAGIKLVRRLKKAYKEGKDVMVAYRTMEEKYEDLDDDVKAAWKELKEFIDAVKAIV